MNILNVEYYKFSVCMFIVTVFIITVCEAFAPSREVRVKNRNNPWFSNVLLEFIYQRDHQHRVSSKFNKDSDWMVYRKLIRNSVTQDGVGSPFLIHVELNTNRAH